MLLGLAHFANTATASQAQGNVLPALLGLTLMQFASRCHQLFGASEGHLWRAEHLWSALMCLWMFRDVGERLRENTLEAGFRYSPWGHVLLPSEP